MHDLDESGRAASGRLPEVDLAIAAVYANSFRTLQPTLRSTGFRTYGLRHEGAGEGVHNRVAEDFLVASRLRRDDPEFEASVGTYFTEAGAAMASRVGLEAASSSAVTLPSPVDLPMALSTAIASRRSTRAFVGEHLRLSELGTLAWAGSGVTGRVQGQGVGAHVATRATSSGGALYPVDVWLGALKVEGAPRGIYRYVPLQHELKVVGDASRLDRLLSSMAVSDDAIMCSHAAALVLLVARPWRSMRKYGPRGMRHVFLEAGAIAAHLNLVAAALGVGSVDCSSVYDDEAHEALGLDGVYEALVHTIVLGVPA